MRILSPKIIILTLIVYCASPCLAEGLLPFQGYLSGVDGVVPDGVRTVSFKVYDAPIGGEVRWAGEVHRLTVNGGLVNTILGSKVSLEKVDFSVVRYLEITVDANQNGRIGPEDPPLLPRQAIVPSLFASQSLQARELGAGDGEAYDWSALFGLESAASGTIRPNAIRDDSITANKLSGGITAAQLAPGSALGNLAKGSVAREKLAASVITLDSLTLENLKQLKQQLREEGDPVGHGYVETSVAKWFESAKPIVLTNTAPQIDEGQEILKLT